MNALWKYVSHGAAHAHIKYCTTYLKLNFKTATANFDRFISKLTAMMDATLFKITNYLHTVGEQNICWLCQDINCKTERNTSFSHIIIPAALVRRVRTVRTEPYTCVIRDLLFSSISIFFNGKSKTTDHCMQKQQHEYGQCCADHTTL